MNFERYCQIKILSKLSSIKKKIQQHIYTKVRANYSLTIISLSERQSFIFYEFSLKLRGYRSYSTTKGTIPPHLLCLSSQGDSKLDPNWVTGFVDGEGSFSVLIVQKNKLKVGWEVKPRFQLEVHKRDLGVIEEIKNFFVAGKISKYGPDAVQLRFESRKDLASVYLHFKKFKLITMKNADFELCCEVQDIIERGEHLTPYGLRKIVAIRAAMNWGLSDKLKLTFPDVVPGQRPKVETPKTIDPNWLAGFVAAEGCFHVMITASRTRSIGFQVSLIFLITQHVRDEKLMKRIRASLNCGNLYKKRKTFELRVTKFDHIIINIIPFFKKYPIHGVKALDFADWCKVAEMMKDKKHLTKQGIENIKKIKAGMNRGRKC